MKSKKFFNMMRNRFFGAAQYIKFCFFSLIPGYRMLHAHGTSTIALRACIMGVKGEISEANDL